MLHNNRRATRRSFGRRALAFGIAMFAMVTLTAVGFAAWLISSNSTIESSGGVVTQEVSQANIKITVTNTDTGSSLIATADTTDANANIAKGDKFDIVFGLPKDASGLVSFTDNSGKDKPENLKFYFKGYVENWARVGEFKFSVKVPDAIVKAAGITKNGSTYSYNANDAYVELPTYAMDKDGKPLPKIVNGAQEGETEAITFERNDAGSFGTLSTTLTDGVTTITLTENQTVEGVTAKVTTFSGWMGFKWGARYANVNPATTFNSGDWANVAKTGIERVLKDGSATTLATYIPNQVHLELLKLQCAVNGERILDYYSVAGITLSGTTIEEYVKGTDTATIAGQLGVLQTKLSEKIYADSFKKPTYTLLIEAIVR